MQYSVGILLMTLFCHIYADKISDQRLCADRSCETVISKAKSLARHKTMDKAFLAFGRGDLITILSKSAGSRPDLWGGEFGGKKGYFPRSFVREIKVEVPNPQFTVETEQHVPLEDKIMGRVPPPPATRQEPLVTEKVADPPPVEQPPPKQPPPRQQTQDDAGHKAAAETLSEVDETELEDETDLSAEADVKDGTGNETVTAERTDPQTPKEKETTKILAQNAQIQTDQQPIDSQIKTEAQATAKQLDIEAKATDKQLDTKAQATDKQIDIDKQATDKQLDIEAKATDKQLDTKAQATDTQIDIDKQATDKQLDIEAQATDKQIDTKAQATDKQIDTKAQATDKQLNTEAHATNKQIDIDKQATDKQLDIEAKATDKQLNTKAQATDKQIDIDKQATDKQLDTKAPASDKQLNNEAQAPDKQLNNEAQATDKELNNEPQAKGKQINTESQALDKQTDIEAQSASKEINDDVQVNELPLTYNEINIDSGKTVGMAEADNELNAEGVVRDDTGIDEMVIAGTDADETDVDETDVDDTDVDDTDIDETDVDDTDIDVDETDVDETDIEEDDTEVVDEEEVDETEVGTATDDESGEGEGLGEDGADTVTQGEPTDTPKGQDGPGEKPAEGDGTLLGNMFRDRIKSQMDTAISTEDKTQELQNESKSHTDEAVKNTIIHPFGGKGSPENTGEELKYDDTTEKILSEFKSDDSEDGPSNADENVVDNTASNDTEPQNETEMDNLKADLKFIDENGDKIVEDMKESDEERAGNKDTKDSVATSKGDLVFQKSERDDTHVNIDSNDHNVVEQEIEENSENVILAKDVHVDTQAQKDTNADTINTSEPKFPESERKSVQPLANDVQPSEVKPLVITSDVAPDVLEISPSSSLLHTEHKYVQSNVDDQSFSSIDIAAVLSETTLQSSTSEIIGTEAAAGSSIEKPVTASEIVTDGSPVSDLPPSTEAKPSTTQHLVFEGTTFPGDYFGDAYPSQSEGLYVVPGEMSMSIPVSSLVQSPYIDQPSILPTTDITSQTDQPPILPTTDITSQTNQPPILPTTAVPSQMERLNSVFTETVNEYTETRNMATDHPTEQIQPTRVDPTIEQASKTDNDITTETLNPTPVVQNVDMSVTIDPSHTILQQNYDTTKESAEVYNTETKSDISMQVLGSSTHGITPSFDDATTSTADIQNILEETAVMDNNTAGSDTVQDQVQPSVDQDFYTTGDFLSRKTLSTGNAASTFTADASAETDSPHPHVHDNQDYGQGHHRDHQHSHDKQDDGQGHHREYHHGHDNRDDREHQDGHHHGPGTPVAGSEPDIAEPAQSGPAPDDNLDDNINASGVSMMSIIELKLKALIDMLPHTMQSALEQEPLGLSPTFTVLVTLISMATLVTASICSCLCKGEKKTGKQDPLDVIRGLEEKLFIATKERENIEDELQIQNKKVEDVEQDLYNQQSTSGHVETDLQTYRLHNDAMKQQIAVFQQQVIDYEHEVAEKSREIQANLHQIAQGEKDIGELEDSIAQLEKSLSKVNHSHAGSAAEVATLQERLHGLTDNLQHLETRKQQLEDEAGDWSEKVTELSEQSTQFSDENRRMQEDLALKETELEVLRDCFLQLKGFHANEEMREEVSDTVAGSSDLADKLHSMMDVSRVNARLKAVEEERDVLQNRFHIETESRQELEDQIEQVKRRMESMQTDKMKADRQCGEAQTKLEVLSKYFKEKETELTRQLGEQEVLKNQNISKLQSSDSHTQQMLEENDSYRQQITDLKTEISKAERDFRSQIAANEKKAHENWLATRAAERELKEARHECGMMRQKLTDLERKLMQGPPGLIRPITTRGIPPPSLMNGPPPPPGMDRGPDRPHSRGSVHGHVTPRLREDDYRGPPMSPDRHPPPPDRRLPPGPPPPGPPPPGIRLPPPMDGRSPPTYGSIRPPPPPHIMDRDRDRRSPPPLPFDRFPPPRGPRPPFPPPPHLGGAPPRGPPPPHLFSPPVGAHDQDNGDRQGQVISPFSRQAAREPAHPQARHQSQV